MVRHAELPEITLAEQIMSMPAFVQRRWTERDVRLLIDEAPEPTPRYELVDGELLVTPSPGGMHQRIVTELIALLGAFLRAHSSGELRPSPSDVRLAPELVVQPDLFVIPNVDGKRPRADAPVTRLLLAIEILSPSSARYDRVIKRRAYQAAGVGEYWIVDEDSRTIERWRPEDVRPEVQDVTLTWSPSDAHEPFVLDVRQFFAAVRDDA